MTLWIHSDPYVYENSRMNLWDQNQLLLRLHEPLLRKGLIAFARLTCFVFCSSFVEALSLLVNLFEFELMHDLVLDLQCVKITKYQTVTSELVTSAYFSELRNTLITSHSGEYLCRWPSDTAYKYKLDEQMFELSEATCCKTNIKLNSESPNMYLNLTEPVRAVDLRYVNNDQKGVQWKNVTLRFTLQCAPDVILFRSKFITNYQN